MRLTPWVLALITMCAGADAPRPPGNAENGRLLLRQFACGTCHRIPGVVAAEGNAAPPLAGIRHRAYLAGMLPNTPANMARWIREPRRIDPRTTMPDLQVSEAHARDMVAYLWGLE
jgi:cytochrome c1